MHVGSPLQLVWLLKVPLIVASQSNQCWQLMLFSWWCAAQAEIDELERLVSHYQEIEDNGEGQGDLLDDFVLSATLVHLCFVISSHLRWLLF